MAKAGERAKRGSQNPAKTVNRRAFLTKASLVGTSLICAAASKRAQTLPARPSTRKQPNILLIFSDQQRYDAVGVYPGSQARTPHLEWLASEGLVFQNAFCTSPMCSPARASLLSGQMPHSHGMVANHENRPGCNLMRLSPS